MKVSLTGSIGWLILLPPSVGWDIMGYESYTLPSYIELSNCSNYNMLNYTDYLSTLQFHFHTLISPSYPPDRPRPPLCLNAEFINGATWWISTRWCVLSVLQNLQSTGDSSSCVYLHIPWNISVTTTINEIQDTYCGQVTWKLFHLQIICSKWKLSSQ